jgi:hypothetical protein
MDQRSIGLFLALKGFIARAGDDELEVGRCPDAIAWSRVTKYLRQWQFLAFPSESSNDAAMIVIDDAILVTLERQPFSSIP